MRNLILCFVAVFFISGCSFKTPPNQWQYKSVNAFDSYTKNFLSGDDVTARHDLNRAIKHSKSSADFTPLARVYLGECALNNMVGIKDTCEDYKALRELLQSKKLDAYYAFINNDIKSQQIKNLPQNYKEFALYVQNKEFNEANKNILNQEKVTSTLLCASLIEDKLQDSTIDEIIKKASFYGYKKAVIFWLNQKAKRAKTKDEKQKLLKKIKIMQSKGRVES